MGSDTVSETLDCNSILTWTEAREDFTAFSRHKSFKSYLIPVSILSDTQVLFEESKSYMQKFRTDTRELGDTINSNITQMVNFGCLRHDTGTSEVVISWVLHSVRTHPLTDQHSKSSNLIARELFEETPTLVVTHAEAPKLVTAVDQTSRNLSDIRTQSAASLHFCSGVVLTQITNN